VLVADLRFRRGRGALRAGARPRYSTPSKALQGAYWRGCGLEGERSLNPRLSHSKAVCSPMMAEPSLPAPAGATPRLANLARRA